MPISVWTNKNSSFPHQFHMINLIISQLISPQRLLWFFFIFNVTDSRFPCVNFNVHCYYLMELTIIRLVTSLVCIRWMAFLLFKSFDEYGTKLWIRFYESQSFLVSCKPCNTQYPVHHFKRAWINFVIPSTRICHLAFHIVNRQ